MNQIIEIHGEHEDHQMTYRTLTFCVSKEADSDVVCQPGVLWTELNEKLEEQGMWKSDMCRHFSFLPIL